VHILVIAGTGEFDELVREVDQMGECGHTFVIQTGSGAYRPSRHPHFRFADDLRPFFEQADLVVSHGGVSTILECLNAGKKLVVVANWRRRDNRQREVVQELSREGHVLCCPHVHELRHYVQKAEQFPFVPYVRPHCEIAQAIQELAGGRKGEGSGRSFGAAS
jgi:beta-1,4-N-acetylglucosaminyltransferase